METLAINDAQPKRLHLDESLDFDAHFILFYWCYRFTNTSKPSKIVECKLTKSTIHLI